jgi:hypothetical protein
MKRRINLNQLSLPFGETQARALSFDGRIRFFWSLISLSALSLVAYVYAINATAHHIAVRQQLEREVVQISSELSTLEFKHIALQNAVTLEVAQSRGFSEIKQPHYVSRDSESSLTLNTSVR